MYNEACSFDKVTTYSERCRDRWPYTYPDTVKTFNITLNMQTLSQKRELQVGICYIKLPGSIAGSTLEDVWLSDQFYVKASVWSSIGGGIHAHGRNYATLPPFEAGDDISLRLRNS